MKKHVFLIQVHKQQQILSKTISHLESDNHYFIINVDKKSDCADEFYNLKDKFKNIYFIKQHNVMHGRFSQIQCTLDQIKFMYEKIPKFDYVHTISGQDYPCVSSKTFDDFFENNDNTYMHIDNKEDLELWKRQNKYSHRLEHWYYMDIFNSRLMNILHIPGILWRFTYWIYRPYDNIDSVCRGWKWFSITKNLMDYICSYIANNPKYVERFKYTISTDEIIFANIVYNHVDELKINPRNSLRYMDWHPTRDYKTLPL
jgi:hypothetical protein